MFAAPRFIAIDDKLSHLQAIVTTLQGLGTSCFGIHYDVSTELHPKHFLGVRGLFMDLHLTSGIVSTDDRNHYGIISGILDANICPTGGPFILIVWTEYPQQCAALQEYLDTHLIGDQAYARPLAILGLPKASFINVADGTALEPGKLEEEVRKLVESIPQLAALLDWETDVLAAAGGTLSSVMSLVPTDKRTTQLYAAELDVILSRLACEAVGKMHVGTDPRGAIAKSLSPILADRILNQSAEGTAAFWPLAITKHGNNPVAKASPDEAGLINRMLHLALPAIEKALPTDWGAVVNWPYDWPAGTDVACLGLTGDQIMGGEFKTEKQDRPNCKPFLVRVGAACDYAQSRPGPITYLLAVAIPQAAKFKTDSDGVPLRMSEAIWKSPVFVLPESASTFHVYVHIRMSISVLPAAAKDWTVVFRFREQLLMQLIAAASDYSSRPGIVQL
jgi:hypothetical protein